MNDAPLTWGTAREMSPFEAMMWRAENDPKMRSPVLAARSGDLLEHLQTTFV